MAERPVHIDDEGENAMTSAVICVKICFGDSRENEKLAK